MRIALLTPFHPSAILGGQERVVSDLASGLAKKKNVSVDVLSLTEQETRSYSRLGHVPAMHFLSQKKWDMENYDIINAHGWAGHWLLQKAPKKNLAISMHGTIAQYLKNVRLPLHRRLYLKATQMRFEKEACEKASHLTALARRQAAEMQEHYGCENGRIRVIGNGINTSLFSPKAKEKSRAKLGLAGFEKIALACARWSVAHKGFDILLKLADSLGKGTALVVNGNVPQHLGRMMKPNMIARTTALSDMPCLYSAADVFVNPSRYEGFGLVTAEAMACGVPAVAFDTGAASELIGKNQGGRLISSIADERGFVSAARGLLDDETGRKALGNAAARRAAAHSVGAMVDNYLRFYREIGE